MFDILKVRNDFPIFNDETNKGLVYLDSAATTHKPLTVINATNQFYRYENANVHRGAYSLSENATLAYENTRINIAKFINAQTNEIVWTKGTTEAINMLAHCLENQLQINDVILISALEHHANIVPWQQICEKTGALLKVIPLNTCQKIDLAQTKSLIKKYSPKIISISHASNALGNIQPVKEIIEYSKPFNSITVIDGAQAFMHLRPDVKALNCDFYVFSAHKALGPTGLGCLYGKYELLNTLPPYQTGGEMIKKVSFEKTTFTQAPHKFEAGTPNIAAVIAFNAAIDYLKQLNQNDVNIYEKSLFIYLVTELKKINGIKLYGDTSNNIGAISFNYRNEHPYDIATLLDNCQIAVRVGHHCAQPLMSELNVQGTIRISIAFYNTFDEINYFITQLKACLLLLD